MAPNFRRILWSLRKLPWNLCLAFCANGRCRTGYHSMRESNMAMLGENVMSKVGPVYGLDAEGELSGSYRPSGHPGVRRSLTPSVI